MAVPILTRRASFGVALFDRIFDTVAGESGDSFPRSAWECLPARSAAFCRDGTARSALDGIPTQSVGTSFSAMERESSISATPDPVSMRQSRLMALFP